jgi:uracil-DNA glycosylase family 4
VTVALAAEECAELTTLADLIRGCRACSELAGRRRAVPGEFPAGARLLLIGEAPGAEEDATGRPFVGRGGRLLDELLAGAGLDRREVAVANVLKCRPPGNRPPARAEAQACRGWLDRQLALVDPAVVVTLGGWAARWLFGPVRIAAVRGRAHPVAGRLVVPTYHPAAALRAGPAGAVRTALRADLALAAGLLR